MRLADTTLQEVVLALRSTGASDEDVLYAAKTEFGEPFRYQKIWGACLVAAGVLVSLTLIGALIGIPVAICGVWIWRKGIRNLAVVDTAFAQYSNGPRFMYAAPSATAYSAIRTGAASAEPEALRHRGADE